MTDEPKAPVVPPMPNEHRVPALIEDLKAWGAQAWEIAQAQAQRADELQATLINRGSVYVTDGHGALWGTAESITWITDELDRLESTLAQRDREVLALRETISAGLEWLYDPDAQPTEQFERIGDWYLRETGYLRPGKDSRMEDTSSPENQKRFGDWCLDKSRGCLAMFRAALASTADAADESAILGTESGEAQP